MLPAAAMGLAQGLVGLTQSAIGLFGQGKRKRAADKAISDIETYQEDPMVAARVNAAMPGQTEAEQAIGQSQTAALSAAKSKKSTQASVAGIVAQSNKAKEGLAVKKGQYKLGAENALVAERAKAFQSRQQKQQLQANIALQDVAAGRQNLSQGLSGLASGLGAFGANGGKLSDIPGVGGLLGKGIGAVKGIFGKSLGKQSDALQASTRQLLKRGAPQVDSYIESPTQ